MSSIRRPRQRALGSALSSIASDIQAAAPIIETAIEKSAACRRRIISWMGKDRTFWMLKAFTGAILASTAAEGTVALTDRLEKYLGWDVKVPTREGKAVRLIDLATHSGGFPREVPHEPGPTNDPFSTISKSAFVAWLKKDGLLFAPGTGALYSNMGFDLLAAALAGALGKQYPELVRERITQPLGMADMPRGSSLVSQGNRSYRPSAVSGHRETNTDG